MRNETRSKWRLEFGRWLRPFLAVLGHKARQRWAPVYLQGLIGPGERKSIQPLVARVAPGDHEQVHHFVATSCWSTEPLEQVLAQHAQQLVGGQGAFLIVDDTTLPKQGHCSVGVAHQYSGNAGKNSNCQCLVSLTLARREVPVPIALRLFVPKAWTDRPSRCTRVGIPAERQVFRTKGSIALEEIDRVRAAGVTFDVLLADAGYGTSAMFRRALTERGLTWAVGILRIQTVYPTEVAVLPRPRSGRGRPPKHPLTTAPRMTAEQALGVLPAQGWRALTWRLGTKGPLRARFAARRVRVADGQPNARGQHLPGDEVWLVGERRSTGEQKYYLSNLPDGTPLRVLAAVIKARWVCEQAHQQLKEELGLDHFEGRSWSGLHHHAVLALIAYAFLQTMRLRQAADLQQPEGPPPQPSLPALRRVLGWFLSVTRRCPWCDGPPALLQSLIRKVAK